MKAPDLLLLLLLLQPGRCGARGSGHCGVRLGQRGRPPRCSPSAGCFGSLSLPPCCYSCEQRVLLPPSPPRGGTRRTATVTPAVSVCPRSAHLSGCHCSPSLEESPSLRTGCARVPRPCTAADMRVALWATPRYSPAVRPLG